MIKSVTPNIIAHFGLFIDANDSLQINKFVRESVESNLAFAGFLVFHCSLKSNAVETFKLLADSSYRVSHRFLSSFNLCLTKTFNA